jgi:signal transduction histidine kinase
MNGIEAMSPIKEPKLLMVGTARYGTNAIVVTVRDMGTGLDAHHRDRIFDAFFTTKPDGMGMGLALSRTIIEAHGGQIWATPNSDRGKTFQFTLPISNIAT